MNRDPFKDQLPQVVPEDSIESRASREFNRELRQERRQKWLRRSLITVVVSAVFGAALVGAYIIWRANNAAVIVDTPTTTEKKQQTTTVYYASETSRIERQGGSVPVMTIYQQVVGQQDAKELFKIGSEQSEIAGMVADKDGKYLAVNYLTKLTVYDLPSGKERFTLQSGTSLNFSQPVISDDGSKLFAFEITAGSVDKPASLFATTAELSSGEQRREVIAAETPALSANIWNKTGDIIASFISNSEFTAPYSFNLGNLQAKRLAENVETMVISDDGERILLPTGSLPDASDCFSGQSTNAFSSLNVATGQSAAEYSDPANVFQLGAAQFSRDYQKILITRYPPVPGTDCGNGETPETETVVISLTDQKATVIDANDIEKEGFALRLQVTPDNATDPKLNQLKYGTTVLHETSAQKFIIPIVAVTTTI